MLDETKANIDRIHNAAEVGHTEANEEYSLEDSKKELTIAYVQTGVKFVKLYGPAVALGTLSIGAMLKSNHILHKRNRALAAAYIAVDKSFKEYRGRVIERFGKDLDRELRFNIKAKEVEEKVVNEDGSESIVKKTLDVADPNAFYSPYSRIYDADCKGWTKSPEHNYTFLLQTQNWANDKLKANGHLFLNEVYDMIGFQRTEAGQIVGWIYDEKNPNGDNFVDFGLFEVNNPKTRDFVNGYERNYVIDFNVDGPIAHLI